MFLITKILIVSNLIFALLATFFYFNGRNVQYRNFDNSAIIGSVIESQKKSLDELKDKLNALDEKHDKLINDYEQSLRDLDKKYDEKLSSLQKDRVGYVNNLTQKFKGNVVGLAEEFSKETGIKVLTK